MLIFKILKKDFLRKKTAAAVVFLFILMSAMLISGGTGLIVDLSGSLDSFFKKAATPHFVQMHSGRLDQSKIDLWSKANSFVNKQQTVEMITVDGPVLYLGENDTGEENSIMDISFVKQNSSFDFLLDLHNRIIRVEPGEIAVPIYYMQRQNMKVGDRVKIINNSYQKEFSVAAFVRDSQMNPSIVHSKRFLVHESDYESIGEIFSDREYLVEFLLNDLEQIDAFSDDYHGAGLPAQGPSVSYFLLKTLNGLTDGIAAGVLILLSFILIIIALLCLRFIMIASIEEDYREIGVMKAVGISASDIRRIYLAKYALTGAAASLLGFALSHVFSPVFNSNILLYIGRASGTAIQQLLPFAAACVIAFIVLVSCLIILRRFGRISAVEALRSGGGTDSSKSSIFPQLRKSRIADINIFMGLRDIVQRFRVFALLIFVFFFCSFLTIIPLHFINTIRSPDFISYMGIGKSDIRIDLRQSENISERYNAMLSRISGDPDVKRFSSGVTSRFTMIDNDGAPEKINIETGDFSMFPLDYIEGRAPVKEDEIALSCLYVQEMDKGIGDKLKLIVDGKRKDMLICGIYQDITNGGKTAKSLIPFNKNTVLWYTMSLDLNPGVGISEKVHDYSAAFHPARITGLEDYLSQTLGSTIAQIKKVAAAAAGVGIFVSILITSLFMKMLIARDTSQIAIMKSGGFTSGDIRIQYLTGALLMLAAGIVLGTVFANTLGQNFVSLLWSFMGASHIRFIIDPLQTYFLFPLILVLSVLSAAVVSISGIKNINIIKMITE